MRRRILEARRQVFENLEAVAHAVSIIGGGAHGRVSSRVEHEKLVRSPGYCVRFVCAG
jgi:hypothetical protein